MARARRGGGYNEQFFRSLGGPGPTIVGFLVIVSIVFGLYLAFTKKLPFTSPGYQLTATFANTANINDGAPVRIAGVKVGEVTGVELEGETAQLTFTVSDEGRPIHSDASIKIRPRIFLEGNFFLDLRPGSPSAPELDDEGSIPISHTATAVQLDEILTALQSPARENLKRFLEGFGTALTYEPTAADDATQDPDVKGETAAAALNDAFAYGGPAERDTALVNEALLGTSPADLSRLIASSGHVFETLLTREAQLKDLITNFNVTTGALAAESASLGLTIERLEPTLTTARASFADLNEALPLLRRFAIELRPGVAELPDTIEASGPFFDQALPLLSRRELGGLASMLAEGTPDLVATTRETIAALPQLSLSSRCASEVLVPTGDVVINDAFGTGAESYKDFFYALVGVAGESQDFDGNGQYVRFQPGGGAQTARTPNPHGDLFASTFHANTISPPLGTQPPLGSKPAYKPEVACHTNQPADLNGPGADVGLPSPVAP